MPTAGPHTAATSGFGKAADAAQEAEHRRVGRGGRLVQEVGDVVAGRKNRFMALDHHHAHRRVVVGRFERVGHGAVHGGGDGIFLVQAVQRDGHHAGVDVAQDFRDAAGGDKGGSVHGVFR
jgi:hypothetical protein